MCDDYLGLVGSPAVFTAASDDNEVAASARGCLHRMETDDTEPPGA
jgi:hypothetical protein